MPAGRARLGYGLHAARPAGAGGTTQRIRHGHYTRLAITFPRGPVLYALDRIRIPVKGVRGGVLAYTWCDVQLPAACVSP